VKNAKIQNEKSSSLLSPWSLVLIAVATLVLGSIMTLGMRSDIHWKIARWFDTNHTIYSAFENSMYQQNAETLTEQPNIVIGSFTFCEQMSSRLKERAFCYGDDYPSVNLIGYVYSKLRKEADQRIYIENMPYYWSNLWSADRRTLGGQPKVRYWQLHSSQSELEWISRKHVKGFFDWVLAFVKSFTNPGQKKELEAYNMSGLEWSEFPQDRHPSVKQIKAKNIPANTYWVNTDNVRVVHMTHEFEEQYSNKFSNTSEFELGKIVNIEELEYAQ